MMRNEQYEGTGNKEGDAKKLGRGQVDPVIRRGGRGLNQRGRGGMNSFDPFSEEKDEVERTGRADREVRGRGGARAEFRGAPRGERRGGMGHGRAQVEEYANYENSGDEGLYNFDQGLVHGGKKQPANRYGGESVFGDRSDSRSVSGKKKRGGNSSSRSRSNKKSQDQSMLSSIRGPEFRGREAEDENESDLSIHELIKKNREDQQKLLESNAKKFDESLVKGPKNKREGQNSNSRKAGNQEEGRMGGRKRFGGDEDIDEKMRITGSITQKSKESNMKIIRPRRFGSSYRINHKNLIQRAAQNLIEKSKSFETNDEVLRKMVVDSEKLIDFASKEEKMIMEDQLAMVENQMDSDELIRFYKSNYKNYALRMYIC